MTFEEADAICSELITWLRSRGGPYPTMDEGYLQTVILSALATGQYVMKRDDEDIRYFACYWLLDQASFDAFDAARTLPKSFNCGTIMYVAEVASRGVKGDSRELIHRLNDLTREQRAAICWHQPHRNYRSCHAKECKI